ncbi:helix-turn-helix domain-containing protein [Natronolimnohabitans sp. A-GB9]|nr:helix-turn-helix domain-containing protein [Natronolimnohabitans sp. A-GB9]MDQ2050167.1 helix-turn-helix domain-containing protein [Natronolimnohabitans sp. A-GB9]
MGYFSYPRETTAEEIADALDIATSTVHKHLVAALGNLFDSLYPVDT